MKKTLLKKLSGSAALLCSAAMIGGGAITGIAAFTPQEAFAENGTTITTGNETGSITINGLQEGDQVIAYKLVDIIFQKTTNTIDYQYTSSIGTDGVTVNGTKYTIDKFTELKDKTGSADKSNINEDTRLVTGALTAKAIAGKTTAGQATVAAGATSATIGNLPLGEYSLVVVSANKAGQPDRVYQVMSGRVNAKVNGNNYQVDGNTVNAKYTTEKIVKKTQDNGAAADSTDDYTIGDAVPFTVTTTVPVYPSNATNKTFEISDTMSDGLTFDNNVTIKVGATTLTAGTDYTYTKNGNGYTVAFKYDNVAKYGGQDVTLTYTGTVNSKAATTGNGDKNTATLKYASNPFQSQNSDESDTTNDFVYGIQILKKAQAGTALPNAVFTIYTDAACTQKLTWAANADKGITAFNGELTTDNNGYAWLNGLKEGTYYYKETKAPAGYQIDTQVRSFTVNKTTATNDCAGTAGVTEKNFVAAGEVIDKPTPVLPITGGQGIMLFAGTAAVLVVAGVLIKRRNDNADIDDDDEE